MVNKGGNWKEKIEKEFEEIAREKSEIEACWQRIKGLDVTEKSMPHGHKGIVKKIKEMVVPAKRTANDKRWRRAEIQREKIILERKREELRRKKGELAKKKGMLEH